MTTCFKDCEPRPMNPEQSPIPLPDPEPFEGRTVPFHR
jgi:hypothetical protein